MAVLISRAGLAGAQRAVVDRVDHQLSLPEVPMTVHLHELIQVPDLKRSSDCDEDHRLLCDAQGSM